jgi:ferredoxin
MYKKMTMVYICAGIVLALWIAGNVYRRKKRRNKIIHVVDKKCIRCGRCIKRCSRRVLEMEGEGDERRLAIKNPDKCTACGDCMGRCKFNALELVERI